MLDFDYLCNDFVYREVEHTDLYKLNLRSLSDGEHKFFYELYDPFFEGVEDSVISKGDLGVEVTLIKHGELHQLNILVEGYVVATCDRCLGEMEVDIYSERDLVVKMGAAYNEESDEILIIPEKEGVLDLQWLLYEEAVLNLPVQRIHPEGECDPEMERLFKSLSVDSADEEQDGVEKDNEGIDLRWAALKKLKDNDK